MLYCCVSVDDDDIVILCVLLKLFGFI